MKICEQWAGSPCISDLRLPAQMGSGFAMGKHR